MNEYFVSVWAILQPRLLVFALLIVIDFVLGVVISVVKKEFKLEYLMHYVNTDGLPVLAWVAVVFITLITGNLIPSGTTLPFVGDAIYATVFLSILASILGSLSSIGVLTTLLGKVGVGEGKTSPPEPPV
jgi:hypothetical protein